MRATADEIFLSLGDPTRRSICKRLWRKGEESGWMLT